MQKKHWQNSTAFLHKNTQKIMNRGELPQLDNVHLWKIHRHTMNISQVQWGKYHNKVSHTNFLVSQYIWKLCLHYSVVYQGYSTMFRNCTTLTKKYFYFLKIPKITRVTSRPLIIDSYNKYNNNEKVWNILRITKKWQRQEVSKCCWKKMKPIYLLNTWLPQSFNM